MAEQSPVVRLEIENTYLKIHKRDGSVDMLDLSHVHRERTETRTDIIYNESTSYGG